jgi:hypothetical protein
MIVRRELLLTQQAPDDHFALTSYLKQQLYSGKSISKGLYLAVGVSQPQAAPAHPKI